MSFSKEVKEELGRQNGNARHCKAAELAGILFICGYILDKEDKKKEIILQTENYIVARKCFTLLKKTFNINTEIVIRKNMAIQKGTTYILAIRNPKQVSAFLEAIKAETIQKSGERGILISSSVCEKACCKRSFIRGVFLAAGSVNDPEKNYHFEIVFSEEKKAEQMREILNCFIEDAKIVQRKKNYVVYVKEGSQIADLLNVMEAHNALMKFENVRILKEMRNSINRQVNCEAANITKTVKAASKQIDDIKLIKNTLGFGQLAQGLEEIANLRLSFPEASLKELGDMLHPPIGKSGVNHRLKRLCCIADGLRQ